MRLAVAIPLAICVGCSRNGSVSIASPASVVPQTEQVDAKPVRPGQLPPLSSLIGKAWDRVWQRLSEDGCALHDTRVAEDGTVEHILRNLRNGFGAVRIYVKDGSIDQVEAWATNALAPYFTSVVGAVQPGVSVKTIEEQHGAPVYVEYGHHGLRMKGWRIDDFLVFVESSNGMVLTPDVGRVYAFRKGASLPSARMWSLKGRTTLQELMDGKTHIEER